MVFSMLKLNLVLALLFVNISVFADERVAPVTCAVISETALDQSAYRVKEVNEARSKLNLDPYLEGDAEILLSIKYDLCILLIMDFEEYKKESKILVLAEKDSDREKTEVSRESTGRTSKKIRGKKKIRAKAKAKRCKARASVKELTR